ncbi:APC family permease [Amycolatopsis sp. NPDC059090]|uniref:APC family permease n=1 Tax=unclassified Amycolatopsis TaxID=2618356 RepID=UPI0036708733
MTAQKRPTTSDSSPVLKGRLTTFKITVMVVAAAAPISCIAGIVPLSFAIGSGASTPAAFLIAGVVLLFFAVGYAAICRRMSSAGGFYKFIAVGLGKPPAVAAALVAIVAYNAVALTCVAGLGYFGSLVLHSLFGLTVPWPVLSVIAVAVVGFLGYREIDVAAKVLVVLLAAEVAMIVVLDVAIVVHKGLDAFPLSIFAPHRVASTGSIGLGLMFALLSFIGFESAALYGEETDEPRKTVPRSTYLSVGVISVFYFLSTWIAVGAIGPDQVQPYAAKELGNTFFDLSDSYASSALTAVMQLTYLTSLLASLLSLHNVTNRYVFVAGRQGLLPRWLGVAHPSHGTPSHASLVQTAVNLLCIGIAMAAGMDPYLDVVTSMTGLGTLGVVLLQLAASAAIGVYFWRRRANLTGTLIATAVAFVGLGLLVVLIVRNFHALTGAESFFIDALPWALVALVVLGSAYGFWLKRTRPARYRGIAADPEQPAFAADCQES